MIVLGDWCGDPIMYGPHAAAAAAAASFAGLWLV
jgi:hypothetical protein